MTVDLVMVVPTYGRPDNARRLQQAFKATCTGRTELHLVLQANDPAWDDYLQDGNPGTWATAPASCGGTGFVAPTNWAVERILARMYQPYAIGFMGDDHLPRTRGWDTAFVETLRRRGTGYVYGNDLIQGEQIPTQVAMTADIPRAFGWFANPICKHLFADNMWRDLGKAARCIRYLPDVVVEHLHYTAGRSADDSTYRIGNSDVRWREDPAAYQVWRDGPGFERDLATLKGLLK